MVGGVGSVIARFRVERFVREFFFREVVSILWGLGFSLIREDFNIYLYEELKRVLKFGIFENRVIERGFLRGILLEVGVWGYGFLGGLFLGRVIRWGLGFWCS